MNKCVSPVELENVSKNYSNRKVIINMDLSIEAGSVVSLLGTNGAGKSTLIKMMLGLDQPTEGKITLNGFCPTNPRSRLTVGVALQDTHFIPELTVRETMQLVRSHYPQPQALGKIIKDFSLSEFVNKPTKLLSQGQQKKLALALAFLGNSKLVFLDEPTAGLDIESRLNVLQYIKAFQNTGATVFLTTHHLEEAEFLSNRILILNKGEITADRSVDRIRGDHRNTEILKGHVHEVNA
jgi:ABC-2 type transport system ATP-binding protein